MPKQTRKPSLRERLAAYNLQKKPEKPTAMQAAAGRLDAMGTPKQVYPPGSVKAKADSVAAGIKARPSAARAPVEKTTQERIDDLRDKAAASYDKAEKTYSEKAKTMYQRQAEDFERRMENIQFRTDDPDTLREMLKYWENDTTLPDSTRQTMIAKIKAKLGISEAGGDEQGYVVGQKYTSPDSGKTHTYLGNGQFSQALD